MTEEQYAGWCDEYKSCRDCCHFDRSMDDLFQHMGICEFSTVGDEHDEDMECYFPDNYKRCHW